MGREGSAGSGTACTALLGGSVPWRILDCNKDISRVSLARE